MAIFQKSIVDKYLLTLDEGLIESAFDTYKSVYVPKIARIRNLRGTIPNPIFTRYWQLGSG